MQLTGKQRQEVTDLLSGRYDDDEGGNRPGNREGLRDVLRDLAYWASNPHEVFQLLTKEDIVALGRILPVLMWHQAKYLVIRLRQSRSQIGGSIEPRAKKGS